MVDTSIWVSHLRKKEPELEHLLLEGLVLCHPYIIGEIALGYLRNRKEILNLLFTLPQPKRLEDEEVLQLVETRKLCGIGIGWIDAHLLGSTLLSRASLWTRDKKLLKATLQLELSYEK